jgi:uncharacterized protein (TIGR03084 family)
VADQTTVLADLRAECTDLDGVVAGLQDAEWARPTPADGWTIAHQIAHLAATFRMAGLAAADPAAFEAMTARLSSNFSANVEAALADFLADPPPVLLERWRQERATAGKAIAGVPADQLLPWLVNPLPPVVLACAGMMEQFAHGQDIADALGVRRTHTDRIRDIVGFAVRTWDFGYQARKLTPPAHPFRFEITGPSGARWDFGPQDADNRIAGPAVDFCLLVTRRRHHADLAVTATGDDAVAWLDIAQAYRGPAGAGRRPGQFS